MTWRRSGSISSGTRGRPAAERRGGGDQAGRIGTLADVDAFEQGAGESDTAHVRPAGLDRQPDHVPARRIDLQRHARPAGAAGARGGALAQKSFAQHRFRERADPIGRQPGATV